MHVCIYAYIHQSHLYIYTDTYIQINFSPFPCLAMIDTSGLEKSWDQAFLVILPVWEYMKSCCLLSAFCKSVSVKQITCRCFRTPLLETAIYFPAWKKNMERTMKVWRVTHTCSIVFPIHSLYSSLCSGQKWLRFSHCSLSYAFFSFISKNSSFSEDRMSSVFLNTVRIKAIHSCNLQLYRLLFFIINPFFSAAFIFAKLTA